MNPNAIDFPPGQRVTPECKAVFRGGVQLHVVVDVVPVQVVVADHGEGDVGRRVVRLGELGGLAGVAPRLLSAVVVLLTIRTFNGATLDMASPRHLRL